MTTITNTSETKLPAIPKNDLLALENPPIPTEKTANTPTKIKLTGRMLNFTRLHISGNDFEQIKTQLNQKFGNHPNSKMLIVLSCEETLDLAELLSLLWDFGLQPIGIVTGKMDDQAHEQKLAIFPADGKRIDVLTDDKKVTVATTQPAVNAVTKDNQQAHISRNNDLAKIKPITFPTETTSETAESYVSSLPQTSHLEGDLVYTTILRSGQSINHVGGDLVLTQGINAGAEAITDYNLHVYGKAEGRLVAGATGDENAKIFCLRFNPSLVSVAGTFCLRENIPSEYLDKAVQVRFERDKGLIFTLMNG